MLSVHQYKPIDPGGSPAVTERFLINVILYPHSPKTTAFLRTALFSSRKIDPIDYCCTPIVVTNQKASLAKVLGKLEASFTDDRLKLDLILVWAEDKRIITGTDLLGYLMRGITKTSERALNERHSY